MEGIRDWLQGVIDHVKTTEDSWKRSIFGPLSDRDEKRDQCRLRGLLDVHAMLGNWAQ